MIFETYVSLNTYDIIKSESSLHVHHSDLYFSFLKLTPRVRLNTNIIHILNGFDGDIPEFSPRGDR